MKYKIIIEEGQNNFSAFSPDLPGCVSTGKTKDEVIQNMQEAIQFHIEGLLEDNIPVPKPSNIVLAEISI
ncbi:MAG: type II toxin-antitoxin system HicB family antitoxin [Spirochaetia bacterium]|nr:type II toxin-antitoxin system HicB family antitoxin [Spirochaetia bacterium]